MSNVTGELRNWQYDIMSNRYVGDIFCDQKRRWLDGKRISTSIVLAVVDKGECLYVVTLNSLYRLNKSQQMGSTHGTRTPSASMVLRGNNQQVDGR